MKHRRTRMSDNKDGVLYHWKESLGFQESPGFQTETQNSCQLIAYQSYKSSEEEKWTEYEHEVGEACDSFGVD